MHFCSYYIRIPEEDLIMTQQPTYGLLQASISSPTQEEWHSATRELYVRITHSQPPVPLVYNRPYPYIETCTDYEHTISRDTRDTTWSVCMGILQRTGSTGSKVSNRNGENLTKCMVRSTTTSLSEPSKLANTLFQQSHFFDLNFQTTNLTPNSY